MVTELDASTEQVRRDETATEAPRRAGSTSERAALVTFVVVSAVAFVTFLIIGRHSWFRGDEWDFLAGREMTLHDIFYPHGGHLVALPFLIFRAMYFVFGLRTYFPYLVLGVLGHLTAAALLRVVMRRAGVGGWMATIVASVFVFFGVGGQNILWAFQITFTGALAFGLGQLILSDHDGPIDRRDWLGLASGFAGLLCSAVAVTMIAVVGLTLLLRGRWRAALFHAAPLTAFYGYYWLQSDHGSFFTTKPSLLYRWDRHGVAAVFDGLGQVPFVGWALAAMVAGGLVLAWRAREPATRRAALGAPLMLLAGALIFLTVTGTTRVWAGINYVESSRYLYIGAALVIPAIGVAADALVRRSRVFVPIVLVLLLIGVPGNISHSNDFAPTSSAGYERYAATIEALPRSELARRVPKTLRPDPTSSPEITVGWLLDAAASGRLPEPRPLSPRAAATVQLRLSLAQTNGGSLDSCVALDMPVTLDLRVGQSFTVQGAVSIQMRRPGGTPSDQVQYGSSFDSGRGPHTLTVVAPVSVGIVPATSHKPAALCPGPAALSQAR